jgi:hypothetical protein
MDHHPADGGWPGADRPPSRLPGRPRVTSPAPLAQDVLPGIRQGSYSSFL